MICKECGANVAETSSTCPGCGAPLGNPWAPPAQDGMSRPEEGDAPFGYSTGGAARKVSLLSKLALTSACIVPPLGLVLGIIATVSARKFKKRPGNMSVALASIFTSLHLGFVWSVMVITVAAGSSSYDDPFYYDDPYLTDPLEEPALPAGFDTDPAGLEANPELQRLLEELMKVQPDGGVADPYANPGF